MRIKFDFLDLETFLAMVETGSFHLASEKLGLSQSSVTRRIQKLEQALNAQLFVRTTREVKPTLAAKRLRVRADAILSDTIEATQALQDDSTAYAHQRARTLTIATLPTVMASVVAPAIASFRKVQPDTRFRLLDLAANEVADAVAQGEADLGICSAPAYDPNTEFERLFIDNMMIALPSGHALAGEDTLSWRKVSKEPMVLPAQGTGNRMLIDDALARAGVPRVWVFEANRTSTALDLVRRGVALAPVPGSVMDKYARTAVSTRPLVSPAVSRAIGLLTKTGCTQSTRLQDFTDAVRRICPAQ